MEEKQENGSNPAPGFKPGTKVLIGLPIYSGAEAQFVVSLVALTLHLAQAGIPFGLLPVSDSLITRGRNTIANLFLQEVDKGEAWTHLLMLDCDLVFEPEDILKMILSDKDIVGGTYPVRGLDWDNVEKAIAAGKRGEDAKLAGTRYVLNLAGMQEIVSTDDGVVKVRHQFEMDNGLIEVIDVGTGMMLIKTGCLIQLKDKVQTFRYDMPGPAYKQQMWDFFGTFIDETERFLSEDYAFCSRWRRMGGKVYAFVCKVNHIGKYMYEGNVERLFSSVTEETAPTPPSELPPSKPELASNVIITDHPESSVV